MPYAAPPTKIAGDVLTSALWNTYIRDNFDAGVMRMLADTTVVGSVAANFDFQSIPATFAQLMLVLQGRGDTVATSVGVNLRVNNDSAGNYDFQFVAGQGAVASAGESLAATALGYGSMPAASAPAGEFGQSRLDIANYAGATAQKSLLAHAIYRTGTATGNLLVIAGAGFWRSTAAINRLTLTPAAGNFAIGTRATLYGLPA